MFKLEAANKKENVSKYLFIKVISNEEINIDVKVYDPYVEEFIYLSPVIDSKGEKFVCYQGQTVIIEYKLMPELTVYEKRIGKLTSNGEYLFVIKKDSNFSFKYSMNGNYEFKKIQIKVKKDEVILKKIKHTLMP